MSKKSTACTFPSKSLDRFISTLTGSPSSYGKYKLTSLVGYYFLLSWLMIVWNYYTNSLINKILSSHSCTLSIIYANFFNSFLPLLQVAFCKHESYAFCIIIVSSNPVRSRNQLKCQHGFVLTASCYFMKRTYKFH